MMDSITIVALANATAQFVALVPLADPVKQTFQEAVNWDPVALGHAIVRSIHASGQRHQNFEETIKDGNTKHWFSINDKGSLLLFHSFSSCEMSRQDGIQFTVWLAGYM